MTTEAVFLEDGGNVLGVGESFDYSRFIRGCGEASEEESGQGKDEM
jgi:hypothetical protein